MLGGGNHSPGTRSSYRTHNHRHPEEPVNIGILDGIRIVDMTVGLAPSVATMLLAEAGADVIKIERPSPGAERDLPGFRTWNRSKRSVVLDLETESGRAQLDNLLAAADVLVHELTPRQATAAGLDDGTLALRHRDLIVSSVLSWPANHAEAERPVDELLAMARLGVCDEQMPVRRAGPVYVRFPLGSWCAVYLAAAGIVARLISRDRTGRAGPAHTSLVQGALVPLGMHWRRVERPTPAMATGMPKEGRGSQMTVYECADGQWMHVMGDPTQAPLVRSALVEVAAEGPGALAAAVRTRPRHQWLQELWAHDVPVQPCLAFGAVFDDEQARANGYVMEIDDPEVGVITTAGTPLTIDPPQAVGGPAPAHGEHSEEVLREWKLRERPRPNFSGGEANFSGGEANFSGGEANFSGGDVRWPLAGLKVLDLGGYLAGPYGPMLLADLGADVIKVEATSGDAMRPTGWAFAGCQRGKRGVALDLRSPSSGPALRALVRWADVVHHNVRMPAARRLGIDPDALRAMNPDAVICHTSSYGPKGARADWPGYDQLFQAQCGWEVAGAGNGNPPMWHRFGFMDHLCALSSVVATLLALYRRQTSGEPSIVAGSLLGAGVLTVSETYRRADGTLAPVPVLDTEQLGVCDGRRLVEVVDGWLAVAASTDEQRAALDKVDLDGQPVAGALASLLAAGVPAEEVRLDQSAEFFDDPANQAAGLVAQYDQAEWGSMQQPGAFWYFGDLGVRLDLAPPALGEHTVSCLSDVGLDQAAIDELLDTAVAVQR